MSVTSILQLNKNVAFYHHKISNISICVFYLSVSFIIVLIHQHSMLLFRVFLLLTAILFLLMVNEILWWFFFKFHFYKLNVTTCHSGYCRNDSDALHKIRKVYSVCILACFLRKSGRKNYPIRLKFGINVHVLCEISCVVSFWCTVPK